jgi:hypothetical protein
VHAFIVLFGIGQPIVISFYLTTQRWSGFLYP